MKTDDFDYELPEEFIAQSPLEPRDSSRLMVLERKTGKITHAVFRDIGQFLRPGDVLVLNETRVIPARLYAHKIPTGGRAEILLLRQRDSRTWEALVGGKGLRPGVHVQVEGGPEAEVIDSLNGARRIVQFEEPVENFINTAGHVPLPPYIHEPLEHPERYQTVYARQSGSAAAPTAGLHFTPQLLDSLSDQGVHITSVTLHVGLDTFAPVTEELPEEHQIHTEWCRLSPETAAAINGARRQGGRVVAVGTTSVRTLESAAQEEGSAIAAYEGSTSLYILPGYTFQAVDMMVTNFHLPRS
ncbi:MAG: tRNA preQ1(34) S-adenosylmethionine ribosyltransferase-isomerase QueA, partial [Chloroflexi bacterium]